MFFVGIDIGKRYHEAGIIDAAGNPIGKTLRFPNTSEGSQKLLEFFNEQDLLPEHTHIGIEATGHYWLSLFSFLDHLGFPTTVFNPLQSDALRGFFIRKTKTDAKDAYLIAQVIRVDLPETSTAPNEDILRLKNLERLRFSFVDQASDLKRKTITLLDQVFPEYETVFSDIFGKSSSQILLQSPLPEDIEAIDTSDLIETLNQVKCIGIRRATEKAKLLKETAKTSFGITVAPDVFKFQIQLLLEQIQLIERQVEEIDLQLSQLIKKQDTFITTITGIGDVLGSVILAEIGGDISKFDHPNKLVAFAGLDASIHQSGNFNASTTHLSKRGSPYLRRAIWQAAFVASNSDPALSLYYKKLRSRGKPHKVAIGAVARKLTHIIYAVLRDHKPYTPHLPTSLKTT